ARARASSPGLPSFRPPPPPFPACAAPLTQHVDGRTPALQPAPRRSPRAPVLTLLPPPQTRKRAHAPPARGHTAPTPPSLNPLLHWSTKRRTRFRAAPRPAGRPQRAAAAAHTGAAAPRPRPRCRGLRSARPRAHPGDAPTQLGAPRVPLLPPPCTVLF
ncbi:MAG: hypothetical protein J3K34DRAFT_410159, partial [Monoraphidium minutum]